MINKNSIDKVIDFLKLNREFDEKLINYIKETVMLRLEVVDESVFNNESGIIDTKLCVPYVFNNESGIIDNKLGVPYVYKEYLTNFNNFIMVKLTDLGIRKLVQASKNENNNIDLLIEDNIREEIVDGYYEMQFYMFLEVFGNIPPNKLSDYVDFNFKIKENYLKMKESKDSVHKSIELMFNDVLNVLNIEFKDIEKFAKIVRENKMSRKELAIGICDYFEIGNQKTRFKLYEYIIKYNIISDNDDND